MESGQGDHCKIVFGHALLTEGVVCPKSTLYNHDLNYLIPLELRSSCRRQ
jgi:hypothetical protein